MTEMFQKCWEDKALKLLYSYPVEMTWKRVRHKPWQMPEPGICLASMVLSDSHKASTDLPSCRCATNAKSWCCLSWVTTWRPMANLKSMMWHIKWAPNAASDTAFRCICLWLENCSNRDNRSQIVLGKIWKAVMTQQLSFVCAFEIAPEIGE